MNDKKALKNEIDSNPSDLNKWMTYIKLLDIDGTSSELRSAYEGVLTEFPLLFGYWKKYAEFEASKSSVSKAIQVYERGIKAVSTSIELWTHYCIFVAEKSSNLDDIRNLFERAIQAVGQDYQGQSLWKKYLEFEISQEEYSNVTNIFTRMLAFPLRDLDQNWESYQTYVLTRPLQEILVQGEEFILQEQIDDMEKKKKVLANREGLYKHNVKEVSKRKNFETAIMRSYFHNQPLDDVQLDNWRNYLDFEEKEGNNSIIIRLYERCLVPCAQYFEFWQRYTYYLEKTNQIDQARNAYQRVTSIFLKKRHEPYIAFAEFEEAQGNFDSARKIFEQICVKGNVESIIRYVYFEQRQSSIDEAVKIFDKFEKTIDEKSHPFYLLIKAQFLEKFNVEKAREVYQSLCSQYILPVIWISYAEFEIKNSKDPKVVNEIFEKSVSFEKMSRTDKIELMTRHHEYLLSIGAKEFRNLEMNMVLLKHDPPQPLIQAPIQQMMQPQMMQMNPQFQQQLLQQQMMQQTQYK